MNQTFTISARFHPAYSPLGRWIRSRAPDRRAAESTYIVAATSLAMGLVVSQCLTWAYLQPVSEPAGFIAAQLVLAAAYAGLALLGRQPAQHVHMTDHGLRIERREETLFVPFSEIRRIRTISAATYYGHYARYAAVRAFVNHIHPDLLMLDVDGQPVVLGLEPEDMVEMDRILAAGTAATYSSPRVGAA